MTIKFRSGYSQIECYNWNVINEKVEGLEAHQICVVDCIAPGKEKENRAL